jgi:hypothetical protein
MGLFSRRGKPEQVSDTWPGLVVPLMAGGAWEEATAATTSQVPDFPAESLPYATTAAAGLLILCATDPHGAWQLVSVGGVDAYGGPEALLATATANLGKRGRIQSQGNDKRVRLTLPEELDLSASLVLIPEAWRATVPMLGDLAISAPTRIGLYVCAADDPEAVAELALITRAKFQEGEGKPVSPDLYRLSAAGLVPLA